MASKSQQQSFNRNWNHAREFIVDAIRQYQMLSFVSVVITKEVPCANWKVLAIENDLSHHVKGCQCTS